MNDGTPLGGESTISLLGCSADSPHRNKTNKNHLYLPGYDKSFILWEELAKFGGCFQRTIIIIIIIYNEPSK
jgi:hypothetical protein